MSRGLLLSLTAALIFFCDSLTARDRGQQRGAEVADPITILPASVSVTSLSPAAAAAKTVDVAVGPGFSFTFSPSAVTIVTGDTVRWTWQGSNHTVTGGSPCSADNTYCSPSDAANCSTAVISNVPTVYTHTFTQAGTFSYFCRVHCFSGMTGTVTVVEPFVKITSVVRDTSGFTINGETAPNTTITIKSAPDLASEFQNPTMTTSNGSGNFSLTDTSATSALMRFYKATYP